MDPKAPPAEDDTTTIPSFSEFERARALPGQPGETSGSFMAPDVPGSAAQPAARAAAGPGGPDAGWAAPVPVGDGPTGPETLIAFPPHEGPAPEVLDADRPGEPDRPLRPGPRRLLVTGALVTSLAVGAVVLVTRPGGSAEAAAVVIAPTASAQPSTAPSVRPGPGPTSTPARTTPHAVVTPTRPAATRTPDHTVPGGGAGARKTKQPDPTPAPKKKAPAAGRTASMALPVPGTMTARVYFGQLTALMTQLRGTVSLNIDENYRAAHPQMCAVTVVYSGVTGEQAWVYAGGVDSNWPAPEGVPGGSVATDGGRVHQQVIGPPGDAAPGSSWSLTSKILVDETTTEAGGSYALKVTARDGDRLTWSFGGTTISCTAG